MCQGGMVGCKAIEHIVAEVGTEIETKIPILVLELRVQSHENLRHRTLARHVLVGLGDFTVLVSIHHFVLNRMSLFIVHLLIQVERARRIPYLMILDGRPRSKRCITGCNTGIVGIISSCQLRDSTLVPSEVIPQLPSEVIVLDGHGIDIELNPLIPHLTHIGGNDVREVRTSRSTHTVQQIFGTLVVILQSTRNTVIQETEVYPQVIGRCFFPLQVRAIAVRLQEIRAQVLPRRIGTQRISRQIEIIADFLLTGDTIPQTKLQVGKHLACRLHPGLIENGPCKSDRRESTPTVVRTESGRTVPTKRSRQQITVHVVPVQTAKERDQIVFFRNAMVSVLPEASLLVYIGPPLFLSGIGRIGLGDVEVGVIEMLPGITCHGINTALDGLEFLVVVHIEIEQQVPSKAVPSGSLTDVLEGRIESRLRRACRIETAPRTLCHIIA